MSEGSAKIAPPPTRFGGPGAAQPKPAGAARPAVPAPPTRFAHAAPAQPKHAAAPARTAAPAPPPTRFGTARPVQAKLRSGTIQRADAGPPQQPLSSYSFDYASKHVNFTDRTRTRVTEGVGGGMTIHHKVSQSHLKKLTRFLGIVNKDGGEAQQTAALRLINVLRPYMARQGDNSSSVFRLLNNMPLNLAYGPTSRHHHMGDIFDPTVDTSSGVDASVVETHGTPRPPLHRRLSLRSIHLSEIDRLIMTLPEGIVALTEQATAGGTVALLDNIAAELGSAVTADASPNKTPFYVADHWEESGGLYTRATTAAVFGTWDPKAKPVVSEADRNRQKRLEKLRGEYKKTPSKQGTKVKIGGMVNELFRPLIELSETYSLDSIRARYREEFDLATRIRVAVGSRAPAWLTPRAPAELGDDSPNVDYFDVLIPEIASDLEFVVSG